MSNREQKTSLWTSIFHQTTYMTHYLLLYLHNDAILNEISIFTAKCVATFGSAIKYRINIPFQILVRNILETSPCNMTGHSEHSSRLIYSYSARIKLTMIKNIFSYGNEGHHSITTLNDVLPPEVLLSIRRPIKIID